MAKPVLAVLEDGSEIRKLIDETGCGLVCEPGEYEKIERNLLWFIEKAGDRQMDKMGWNGYEYLIRNLTKNMSVNRYMEAIKAL